MISLALRIIAHRPLRYFVALLGISVAAGLAFVQLGLYLGFKENASVIVDHTEGDLWVCERFQDNFDFPNVIGRHHLDKVRSTPGVAWAFPMVIVFADWKLPDGAEQTVQVVGFDPEKGVGRPWQMVEGSFWDELAPPGCVSVDTESRRKLRHPKLGSIAEVNGIKVKITALTRGIRSFQGKPIVFTNIDTARAFRRDLQPDKLHYIIVGLNPDAAAEEVMSRLQETSAAGPSGVYSDHTSVYTKAEFSMMAQEYWLTSTGAGKALALAAVLGLIVGIVVAGQVLYTSTLEHIKEYGTLKAIGATNAQVTAAIVAQAVAWAIPAHLIAGGLLLVAMKNIGGIGIQISLNAETYGILGFFTVFVCILSSLLSVLRVMSVEPADVFKG